MFHKENCNEWESELEEAEWREKLEKVSEEERRERGIEEGSDTGDIQ